MLDLALHRQEVQFSGMIVQREADEEQDTWVDGKGRDVYGNKDGPLGQILPVLGWRRAAVPPDPGRRGGTNENVMALHQHSSGSPE